MKPAAFDYADPDTIDEVLELLWQYGADAKLLAGGQSLVPLMNFRLARPAVIVDLNRVVGLDAINEEDGGVRVGAMVRQRSLERWAAHNPRWRILAQALGHVGHLAIRTRGTVGGSLAHADPAAELPALLLCLGGQLTIRSKNGERCVGDAEFFRGPLTTALEPHEMLVDVRFQQPPERCAFEEVSRRHGDFAMVGAVACVERNAHGVVSHARVGLFGVADTPVRAPAAESALVGGASTSEAAQLADRDLDPPDDLHASASYRRRVARVLTQRVLERALQ